MVKRPVPKEKVLKKKIRRRHDGLESRCFNAAHAGRNHSCRTDVTKEEIKNKESPVERVRRTGALRSKSTGTEVEIKKDEQWNDGDCAFVGKERKEQTQACKKNT